MTTYPSQASLLKKYDVPTPRYTSYPTVPFWNTELFSREKWINSVRKTFNESNEEKGISLYIHLPFCESLCTYCACTTRITKNHNVEIPYIQSILKEWEGYKNIFGRKPIIRELHLGGGTPTFFSPENLRWLISYILEDVEVHQDFEFSFEGHPNNTTREHLQTLFDLGFRRVSFGVQDLNEKVQQTIHRIQPFENLQKVTLQAREIGYQSVSYDLVYGLPFQTPFTVTDTLEQVLTLKPDRLAFYSYAHVPWLKPGQRGYEDADLPSQALKRHLYEIGRHMLKKNDYADIGMDHFALRHDSLFKAHIAGKLHRNFMGYTTTNTDLLIGLGSSAISDAKYAYAQNLKKVEDYMADIKTNGSAVFKGHMLTDEDLIIRKCILDISCNGKLSESLLQQVVDKNILDTLIEMEKEGILYLDDSGLRVTTAGAPFIRNICKVFDQRMSTQEDQVQIFSKAI
ncbi:oxygen-independent coproporphyrinogen III oxidase [Chryseosolibacter indicus]|uniref:Coproporphyrinogen-III oxidase n=1 Tax=Chryseosolibacter indicus TaxID=2782351 RepID=A0ABS5VS90_9BACT|nr:oxygen-independent coproporphyrinogen III oxidase [Chryseosolibacter indicus]MBT1703739.1 oxygen-independent coproporphyrinogen III oxidase [Chryseosolibacter indicus]